MALVESFSGIRGIYGRDLTDSIASKYAWSYLSFLRGKTGKKTPTIVIGMDTRASGVKISDAVMGILDCSFIDVGIAPTPAIEFAVRHFDADGGIIITASHNEPYWNGFKFLGNDGAVLNEREMGMVIQNFRIGSFRDFHKIQERKITGRNAEAIRGYSEFIFGIVGRKNIEGIRNSAQKIVIDPNGGAGAVAKKILEQAGVSAIGVNMPYGQFSRMVEPTEDSLLYLKNIIDEKNADFAAGFDCDADRVEILMKNGQLLSGNYMLALAADDILSNAENPQNQAVVTNDATSIVVKETAEKHGAKILEVEVGEANVVEEMRKSKAVLGGEGSSGGVIIPPSKCRDGILTLLMVMSIIAKKNMRLEDIIEKFPKYFTLGRKMEFDMANHDKIKAYLKNHYMKKGFKITENGGAKGSLKAVTGSSFVWFRASKTEPNAFRIISDSNKKEKAEKLISEAVEAFNEANESG
jgi:phosphomannomutase/phosphoglucomutase